VADKMPEMIGEKVLERKNDLEVKDKVIMDYVVDGNSFLI